MSFEIINGANEAFELSSFGPKLNTDILASVKAKAPEAEKLTNETALKIFKQIKLKSDVLSFLTKPIVLGGISACIFTVGLIICAATPILFPLAPVAALLPPIALGIALAAVGGGVMGYSIQNGFNGFLPSLSRAYKQQSTDAAKYIERIKNSDEELTFTYTERSSSWRLVSSPSSQPA